MGYRCDSCGFAVKAGTSCKKVVVLVREVHFPERPKANKAKVVQKNGKKKAVWIPDPGGVGTQIVKEAKMCTRCAHDWHKEHPKPFVVQ